MTLIKHGDYMEDKFFRINTLMDFYGSLLPQKQRRVMSMYYIYDCSLNEIANEFNISKQAVSDNMKRAENNLENYEKKLKLIDITEKRDKETLLEKEKLKKYFDEFEKNSREYDKVLYKKIKTLILE